MPEATHTPKQLRVLRSQAVLVVTWQDGETSSFPLPWLRTNCPCATCRTLREEKKETSDLLELSSKPPPSAEVSDIEMVGGYAFRFTWRDGHNTGIYSFSWLYERRQAAAQESP